MMKKENEWEKGKKSWLRYSLPSFRRKGAATFERKVTKKKKCYALRGAKRWGGKRRERKVVRFFNQLTRGKSEKAHNRPGKEKKRRTIKCPPARKEVRSKKRQKRPLSAAPTRGREERKKLSFNPHKKKKKKEG